MKRILSHAILVLCVMACAQCSDNSSDNDSVQKSDAKKILTFLLDDITPAAEVTLNEEAGTIAVTVPEGTNILSLTPVIGISEKASMNPQSGTAQNFSVPVSYVVTAEDRSTKTYTVTVTVANLTCEIKMLPGFRHRMAIAYREDKTIDQVIYTKYDDETKRHYETYNYEDGRISHIYTTEDGVVGVRRDYFYSENMILEKLYYPYVSPELAGYRKYYFENNKLTARAEYFTGEDVCGDSATYYYDEKGNITKQRSFFSCNQEVDESTYEYDDKPNPYATIGFIPSVSESHLGYFLGFILSNNNVTKRTTRHPETGEVLKTLVYTYTYNAQGQPLTRTAIAGNETDTRPFSYTCVTAE